MTGQLNEKSAGSSRRTILIGDVHGCARELEQLISALQVTPSDRLICVGDLVCKGPENVRVLEWAMSTVNLTCLLGNHEARLLRYFQNGLPATFEKPYDGDLIAQMGDRFARYMQFVQTWPVYVDEPEFLAVHAGLDPRVKSLSEQRLENLTTIRLLEGLNEPWYEHYHHEKLVVFGHWARREPVLRANAIGLDTGCVYGGELTALVLPERRLVRVKAHREYQKKAKWT